MLWIAPAIGMFMPLLAAPGMKLCREWRGLISSGLAIAGIVLNLGMFMFPFILPSSVNPQFSLMVGDTSSGHLALFIMLVCTVVFMPIILTCTSWVFHIMRGRFQPEAIASGKSHAD